MPSNSEVVRSALLDDPTGFITELPDRVILEDGAEVDVVLERSGPRIAGVEVKLSSTGPGAPIILIDTRPLQRVIVAKN